VRRTCLELFSPQNVVLDGTQDPCAGLTAANPLVATCAAVFNLTTAQVLAIEKNPANQYNGLLGGNPNLDPETSDTFSFGFVLRRPSCRASTLGRLLRHQGEGLHLGHRRGRHHQPLRADLDPFFCSLVHRDAQGSIWLSTRASCRTPR
jgi:hypothetical protein